MVRSQPFDRSAEQLWIAGETPISRALSRLAEGVDFRVSLFSCPQEVISKSVLSVPPASPTTAIVFLDSLEDQVAILRHWIKVPLVFLGVVGSREQRSEILSRLQSINATRGQLERIHCPVGLPIGATSVEEAAIGIIAHLIQNRSDRRISHEAALRIKSPSLIKARA
jgi:xanthine dehydrogenase accessory factor